MIDGLTATSDEERTMPEIPHIEDATLDQDFTWAEYQESLRSLKIKSSPGLDGVSYRVIKNFPRVAHESFLRVFNRIMRDGEFPSDWKEFAVLLLPKPGGKGYRPISLAQNLLKIMETLVEGRM